MKNNLFKFLALLIGLGLAAPATVLSHGWGGYEQGTKARGMGAAFTGLADDPSAIFYNPAGITQLEGKQLSIGFSAPTVQGDFLSNGTSGQPGVNPGDETSIDEQYFFIPNTYFSYQYNEKLFLGIAEYTIFGLGFAWPDSFEGRFAPGGINGEIQTMTLNPVAAYKVSDKLSAALGARIERAELNLQNQLFVTPGVDEIRSEISGDDIAFGWNAGLLYTITDEISVGLSYRSKMGHSIDGLDVEFNPQIDMLGSVPVGITNTNADLDVDLPQFASVGIAWSNHPFTVTVDAYWWDWSQIDQLNFRLDDPVAGQSSITVPMDWNDTWSYAIGFEYVVNAFDRDISLRAGFMYEECPVPDETVSPAGYQGDNLIYSIGIGSQIGPVYSDFFFSFIDTRDRTWDNALGSASNPGGGQVTGEFKGYQTFIIGSNLTFKF